MDTNNDDGPSLADVLLTLKDISERETDDDVDIAVLTDIKVGTDGRLHIPKDTREKYDIEEGDYLDAILRIGGD